MEREPTVDIPRPGPTPYLAATVDLSVSHAFKCIMSNFLLAVGSAMLLAAIPKVAKRYLDRDSIKDIDEPPEKRMRFTEESLFK